MPAISVVMPARNAGHTLAMTLDSLVEQSWRDFEVVLINDGSTDTTAQVAESYADRLSMRIVHHAESQGVARSINAGIAASSGECIARLDADDLARSDRLEKQWAYMQAHAQVDVCGSHMEVFSDAPDTPSVRHLLAHPTSHAQIKTALVQRSTLSHPSVMMRQRFFELAGLYDPRFDFAEDYELWTRGALLGAQYANIAEPLTYYRKHAGQVSRQKAQLQFDRDLAIKRKYLVAWLDGVSPAHLAEFLSLQVQFRSREMALSVLAESTEALLTLARRLPDLGEYTALVSNSMRRHLG